MKQLKGIAENISGTIIGRFTDKKTGLLHKKSKLVIQNCHTNQGYACSLCKDTVLHYPEPIVHSVEGFDSLNSGDIVAIYPDGRINIVYEINSVHNSLFITGRCNTNCMTCPQPPVNDDEDHFNELEKIISLMDCNTKHLGITGGEPTLMGIKLFDLIKIVKKKLPKVSLTLLTNGIKLSDFEFAKNFAIINHPDLLIDIPLHSDTDTGHNEIIRANGFFKTIQGIYNLAKLRQKIGIRIVIHKMNYKRLPHIAEFIYRNFPFVIHIAFMQMEPTGFAKDHLEELWIDPFDYNPELEKAIRILENRDLTVSIYNFQLCILPEYMRSFARQSISDWKNIYLPLCNDCKCKSVCPGLFESSLKIHSQYFKPL